MMSLMCESFLMMMNKRSHMHFSEILKRTTEINIFRIGASGQRKTLSCGCSRGHGQMTYFVA